ncbi:MAG: N-acyl homoserine lactonase family protein [Pseudomonadota bacterium]|nr:N-acyl homoserine lactonase family protein [Pseudomonadota bacterium]|tara:strand:- start:832 stop:1725 length:894 start_codon:yes stop_codon:yes gene_type:complete
MRTKTIALISGILLAVTLAALRLAFAEEPRIQNGEAAATDASVLLYVFNCGDFRFPSVANFSIGDDETTVRELVVPCYIINHPRGTLLWDGGLPSAIANISGWQRNPETGVQVRMQQTLQSQLLEMDLGFDLTSINLAAFSHIHYDHVGVANELTNAKWLVQRGDYEVVAKGGTVPGYDPALLAEIKKRPTQLLDGDYDVFGDGKVRLISATGHTPGHQVLYVELADFGPLMLSGDLYHFRLSRDQRRVPMFNVDKNQTLAAMDKVEALVSETGATFWIEHDAALFETLKLAPNFYR